MKSLILFIPAFIFILSFSASVYSQDNDGTETEVNATETEVNATETEVNATETDVNAVETNTLAAGEICIVSGETIGEGEGVAYSYMGTDYKFCCKNCLKKFKSEPLDYIKGELNCPVMGEPASKDEFVIVDNVKYYMCCSSCKAKFEKNPEKYLNKEKKDS